MWGMALGIVLELLHQLALRRAFEYAGNGVVFAMAIAALLILYLPPLAWMASISVAHLLWTAGGILIAKLFFVLRTIRGLRPKGRA